MAKSKQNSSTLSNLKSSFSNLSPEAKRKMLAGVTALAGGALGSYVAGENHRALGALLGAGAAGGLALSADALGNLVSGSLNKVSPPPKSSTSGLLTRELPIAAGAFSIPLALQLQRPSTSRFRAILNALQSSKGRSPLKSEAASLMGELDALRSTPVASGLRGLRDRLAVHRDISNKINQAAGNGILTSAPKDLALSPFRRLMSRNLPRRSAVYGTAALATAFVGSRILNRIKDNRSKIDRGWS
jgi:hypothetical protein